MSVGAVGNSLGTATDDASAASQLADALDGGWRPGLPESPIVLFAGERYVQRTAFDLVELVPRGTQPLRSPAAPLGEWRLLASGVLHVTSMRFGLQGSSGWFDVAFRDVRASEVVSDGLLLFLEARPPIKLVVVWPTYLYVLFRFLAHGEICRPAT